MCFKVVGLRATTRTLHRLVAALEGREFGFHAETSFTLTLERFTRPLRAGLLLGSFGMFRFLRFRFGLFGFRSRGFRRLYDFLLASFFNQRFLGVRCVAFFLVGHLLLHASASQRMNGADDMPARGFTEVTAHWAPCREQEPAQAGDHPKPYPGWEKAREAASGLPAAA